MISETMKIGHLTVFQYVYENMNMLATLWTHIITHQMAMWVGPTLAQSRYRLLDVGPTLAMHDCGHMTSDTKATHYKRIAQQVHTVRIGGKILVQGSALKTYAIDMFKYQVISKLQNDFTICIPHNWRYVGWIPLQRVSNAELWYFRSYQLNQPSNKWSSPWFEISSRSSDPTEMKQCFDTSITTWKVKSLWVVFKWRITYTTYGR